ncbi:MAG: hypothetical protein Q7S81_01945 [bacterium]|nr:hypothetical protein [bacterium]
MDKKLTKDLFIISFSIIVAVILVKTDAIINLINSTKEYEIIASFIAGIFYTSIFTVAPATAAIIEIAQKSNPFLIALVGGFGALLGDYIIFKYIRDNISGYISSIARKIRHESILESKIFSFSFAIIGAVIVASPLPDEIGLALMGITKMRTLYFVPISYFLNSIGIFVLALIGSVI